MQCPNTFINVGFYVCSTIQLSDHLGFLSSRIHYTKAALLILLNMVNIFLDLSVVSLIKRIFRLLPLMIKTGLSQVLQ